jgi:hypothetical protein
VKSRLAAGEAIPDIKERLDVRIPAERRPEGGVNWWIIGGAALGALVLGGAAVRMFLRARRAEVQRPRPPWEIAIEELARLRSAKLVEAGRVEEFYVGLSGLVRRYVERRFLIMAPEMTTDEFLREAKKHASLTAPHKELLAGFLAASDLVKFARYVPDAGEAQNAMEAAERFVRESAVEQADQTRPAEAGGPAGGSRVGGRR